jgi:hypothetical protein
MILNHRQIRQGYMSFLSGLKDDGPLVGLNQELLIGFPLSNILGGSPRGVM